MKLVKEGGVTVAQAARDLDVHENVLRKWMSEQAEDPQQSFPGKGGMKPEADEIGVLKEENAMPTAGEVVVFDNLVEQPHSLKNYEQRFEEMAVQHAAWINSFFIGIYRDRYFVLHTETQDEHARRLFSMPTRPLFINRVAVEPKGDWSIDSERYRLLDR